MDGLTAWKATIESLDVQKIDEDCLNGLHMMSKIETFKSLKPVIKAKLSEYKAKQSKALIPKNNEHQKALIPKNNDPSEARVKQVGETEVFVQIKSNIQKATILSLISMYDNNLEKQVQIVPMDMKGNFLKPIKVTLRQLIQEIDRTLPMPK